MSESSTVQTGNKQFITTWLLSLLLGGLGVDRFYLGKIGTGIVKLITFGGLGIWYLIDLILILTNAMKDKQGNKLQGYEEGSNKKIALIVTAAVLLLSIIFGSTTGAQNRAALDDATRSADSQTNSAPTTETESTPAAPETAPAQKSAPATPSMTTSQKNAVGKAKSYLQFTAFSHDGLVSQLEYDKFSHDDAVYGADNSGADWNQQAAAKAKSYMQFSQFSRQGLIDQLLYDKFTQAQAESGANAVGI